MKTIKVKDCNDCPFRATVYNDNTLGDDAVEHCSLSNKLIKSYDSHLEQVIILEKPYWCNLEPMQINV